MLNGDTNPAPSTPTASIAATIWSPVTSAGPCNVPAQGRPGWVGSKGGTGASNIGIASGPPDGTVAQRQCGASHQDQSNRRCLTADALAGSGRLSFADARG